MEVSVVKIETFITDINGGRHGGSMYDHTRKLREFAELPDVEIISTDTANIPNPNANSGDKGELITTITYKKRTLML